MYDLYRDLTTRFTTNLARRVVPAGWVTTSAALAGHDSIGDLALAARHCRDHPRRSDQTILGLLAVAHPDARETLLWALAPILRTRLASIGVKTRGYLNDSVTELALVIAEADPTTEATGQVAYRLVNRARGRNQKTYERHNATEQRTDTLPSHYASAPPPAAITPDCSEVALARIQLDQLRQAVLTARSQGLITDRQWAAYQADLNGHRVGPTTSANRMRRHRTRKTIHNAIEVAGYVHAA